jgi:hypothetical protein
MTNNSLDGFIVNCPFPQGLLWKHKPTPLTVHTFQLVSLLFILEFLTSFLSYDCSQPGLHIFLSWACLLLPVFDHWRGCEFLCFQDYFGTSLFTSLNPCVKVTLAWVWTIIQSDITSNGIIPNVEIAKD